MLDFLIGKKPKILIIGDLMVDNYIWCDCKRVSPEAPVLVMNAKRNDKGLAVRQMCMRICKALAQRLMR